MIAPADRFEKFPPASRKPPPDRPRPAATTRIFHAAGNIERGIDKASAFCNSNGDHKSRQAAPGASRNSAALADNSRAELWL
jgi:hypothetical protein